MSKISYTHKWSWMTDHVSKMSSKLDRVISEVSKMNNVKGSLSLITGMSKLLLKAKH